MAIRKVFTKTNEDSAVYWKTEEGIGLCDEGVREVCKQFAQDATKIRLLVRKTKPKNLYKWRSVLAFPSSPEVQYTKNAHKLTTTQDGNYWNTPYSFYEMRPSVGRLMKRYKIQDNQIIYVKVEVIK